jgi:hypothetical protein
VGVGGLEDDWGGGGCGVIWGVIWGVILGVMPKVN